MDVYIGSIYIYAIYTQLHPYIYTPALYLFTYTNQPGSYTYIPLRQPDDTYQYVYPYNHEPTNPSCALHLYMMADMHDTL